MSQEIQSPAHQKKPWTDRLVAKMLLMPGAYALCLAAGILIGWGIFSPSDQNAGNSAAYADLQTKAEQCEKQAAALRQEIAGGAQAPEAEAPSDSDSKQAKNVYKIGDVLEFDDYDLTVAEVSTPEYIAGDYDEKIEPGQGESLALVKYHWLHKSNEAVGKRCWGPYISQVIVADEEGRQYLLSDKSGYIPGNDCSNGLLTGQETDYYQAYIGLAGAKPYSISICSGYSESSCKTVLLD